MTFPWIKLYPRFWPFPHFHHNFALPSPDHLTINWPSSGPYLTLWHNLRSWLGVWANQQVLWCLKKWVVRWPWAWQWYVRLDHCGSMTITGGVAAMPRSPLQYQCCSAAGFWDMLKNDNNKNTLSHTFWTDALQYNVYNTSCLSDSRHHTFCSSSSFASVSGPGCLSAAA